MRKRRALLNLAYDVALLVPGVGSLFVIYEGVENIGAYYSAKGDLEKEGKKEELKMLKTKFFKNHVIYPVAKTLGRLSITALYSLINQHIAYFDLSWMLVGTIVGRDPYSLEKRKKEILKSVEISKKI